MIGLKQLGILEIQGRTLSLKTVGTLEQAIGFGAFLLLLFLRKKRPMIAFLLPLLLAWAVALLFGIAEIRDVTAFPKTPLLFPFSWKFPAPRLWDDVLSILLITIFDTGATLTAIAYLRGHDMRHLKKIFMADTLGSVLAGCLGVTTCAFYAESSAGICAGAKGRIAGCTIAIGALGFLFFAPLLSSIPLCATAPLLLGIGGILASEAREIKKSILFAVPAITTALAIPIFVSIYWGLALGFLSYTLAHLLGGRARSIRPTVWIFTALFLLQLVKAQLS